MYFEIRKPPIIVVTPRTSDTGVTDRREDLAVGEETSVFCVVVDLVTLLCVLGSPCVVTDCREDRAVGKETSVLVTFSP